MIFSKLLLFCLIRIATTLNQILVSFNQLLMTVNAHTRFRVALTAARMLLAWSIPLQMLDKSDEKQTQNDYHQSRRLKH